jgi:formylglycine-generating enzyme required for sulfatase activity
MAHDVFISYAIKEDVSVADAICKALEEAGVRCWYAPRDVPYAVDYEDAIVDAISGSKLMVLILSSHANNSAHVKREVQNACREEPQIPVLPFQVEEIILNKALRYYIGSVNWLSALTPPLEDHLQRLVNYVQARLPQHNQSRDLGMQGNQPIEVEISKEDEEVRQRTEGETRLYAEEEEAALHLAGEAKHLRVAEQSVIPPRTEPANEQLNAHDPFAVNTTPIFTSTSQLHDEHATSEVVREVLFPETKNRRGMMVVIIFFTVILAVIAPVIWMRTSDDKLHAAAVSPHLGNQLGWSNAISLNPQPPPGMAYVLGGEFMMGRNDGDEYERPAHKVTVKSFFIDIYEVTNEEYEKFTRTEEGRQYIPQGWANGTYLVGAGRKPVTGVTWNAASAYARWAGKRLPTEEEWEFAARGTDGRRYPWDNDWRAGLANADGASSGLVAVGTYKGASPFGAFDMVGNAWEWTNSKMIPYPGGHLPIKVTDNLKVIRGGSLGSNRNQATTTYRRGWLAGGEDDYGNTGFRCVKDIDSSSK